MIRRQHVVGDFFDSAEALRSALDLRFKNQYSQDLSWQYFCDPQMYTYLRTAPQGVFPQAVLDSFMQRLRLWCMESLGLVPMGLPTLHLMVNGCRLGLHSDFHNGTWGYVYSLTRWQSRKFSGGETLLLRDGVPSYKRHHVQGDALYELIPANFNQLLVFDDRIAHGTPVIEGSMDPFEGRIALVGHIRATSPVVSGSRPGAQVRRVILEALPQLRDRIRNFKDVQGTVTYRLVVGASGTVESVTMLTDNVITALTGYEHSDAVAAVKSIIQQKLSGLKFPAADGKSAVIVPVLIPLPDLTPIEIVIPHHAARDALCEWAAAHLDQGAGPEFQGSWEGQTFCVCEPIAGSIRIEPREIQIRFDPPMWVPSQREKFQLTLTEWARIAAAAASR